MPANDPSGDSPPLLSWNEKAWMPASFSAAYEPTNTMSGTEDDISSSGEKEEGARAASQKPSRSKTTRQNRRDASRTNYPESHSKEGKQVNSEIILPIGHRTIPVLPVRCFPKFPGLCLS